MDKQSSSWDPLGRDTRHIKSASNIRLRPQQPETKYWIYVYGDIVEAEGGAKGPPPVHYGREVGWSGGQGDYEFVN